MSIVYYNIYKPFLLGILTGTILFIFPKLRGLESVLTTNFIIYSNLNVSRNQALSRKV